MNTPGAITYTVTPAYSVGYEGDCSRAIGQQVRTSSGFLAGVVLAAVHSCWRALVVPMLVSRQITAGPFYLPILAPRWAPSHADFHEASFANPSRKPSRRKGRSDDEGNGNVEDNEALTHGASFRASGSDGSQFERHSMASDGGKMPARSLGT